VEALSTQLYVAVAALSTLVVAAIVTERERFGERLAASRARVIGAADGERRRLERNLHDGAQQRLTALAFQLREASGRVQQAPEQAPILFHDAETELSLAIDELRDLAHGIHPAVLTDLGLEAAAENIAGRAQMPVTVDMELPRTRLDDGVEATAYYVIAESVANAQKHASASAIWIRASLAHGKLHLAIGDDGVGGATDRSGSGLEGLRDRVEASGGTFVVDSPPGRGTLITATIPTA